MIETGLFVFAYGAGAGLTAFLFMRAGVELIDHTNFPTWGGFGVAFWPLGIWGAFAKLAFKSCERRDQERIERRRREEELLKTEGLR